MPSRFALLVVLLAAPTLACAAIYKWTDENGTTVYSNKPPEGAQLAKQAKVVVPDEAPTPASEAAAREADARRERELIERLSRLERQLAATQYAPPVQYAPPAQYAPPPTQYMAPVEDYYPPYYYPGPGYYPGIAFPTGVVVRRSRFFARPIHGRAFANHGFHPSRH